MKTHETGSHCLRFRNNLEFGRLDANDEKHADNCSACRELQQNRANAGHASCMVSSDKWSPPPWQQVKAKILENERRIRKEEILQRLPSTGFELKSAMLSFSLAVFLIVSLATISSNTGRVLSGQYNILQRVVAQLGKLPSSLAGLTVSETVD